MFCDQYFHDHAFKYQICFLSAFITRYRSQDCILNVSSTLDTSGNEDSEDREDESEDSDESNTESDHADASRESSTSSEDDPASHRSGRHREKLRRRKRKRDLMLKQKQREKKISQKDKLLVGSPCMFVDRCIMKIMSGAS